MAKRKSTGMGLGSWALIAGAAAAGVYAYLQLSKDAVTVGALRGVAACAGCAQGLSGSKVRAHQWLQSQMQYQGEDPMVNEVIDEVSGMERGKAGEFAKVLLREYGQGTTYENVPWNGIGRPEW